MTDRYDWHNWAPTTCNTVKEIKVFLQENKIYGKVIQSITCVGIGANLRQENLRCQARTVLAREGISYELIDSGKVPLGKAILPFEISVCEPVIIAFEDNTTLEMQMLDSGIINLSVNQLSPYTEDGTNFSNVDADRLFSKLKGASIRNVSVIKKNRHPHLEMYYQKVEFELFGDGGFYLAKYYNCWNWFGLYESVTHTDFGRAPEKVTCDTLRKATKNRTQIVIVEGHDGGSCFWISPIRAVGKGRKIQIEKCGAEEISIEEDDVGSMLYYFLEQIYDSDLQKPFRNPSDCGLDFEWNLEHNVFTYKSIQTMIENIREHTRLLQTDYDNPILDELKEGFYPWQFDSGCLYCKGTPQGEEVIRKNVHVAVEFYERFCDRMESMMKHAHRYNLISFMGP
ncbi:MAG: hypothetical protein J6D04_02565 [Clostridia bacterium]|nr:hypothetical protein [Clostridia bacterium]